MILNYLFSNEWIIKMNYQIENNIFNNNDIKYNKRNFENCFNIINKHEMTLKVILSLNLLFLQMK